MRTHPFLHSKRRMAGGSRGFTRMEFLVLVAVVLVLLAIIFPVYTMMRKRAHKQVALERMKALAGAISTYTSQNGGLLPREDAEGEDDWAIAASAAAKDAWYNALPRSLGKKGAGDFNEISFYTDENILYLPGADYPEKKKVAKPQFAIAYNTKLERKDAAGKKERLKFSQITDPSRTVALLEQGLDNEARTLPIQTKTDYDGSPKGSAKSFVGRYNGIGMLGFMDGHAEPVKAADLLTDTGDFPFPPTNVVWSARPEDDPNKDGANRTKKK